MDQIVERNRSLRDIDESHRYVLAESLRKYKVYYTRSIMKVYFSEAVHTDGVTYAAVVHKVDRKKFLNDGYSIFMLDGRHWRDSVKMHQDKHGVAWASEPLPIHYEFGLDCKPNLLAKKKKVSKIVSI